VRTCLRVLAVTVAGTLLAGCSVSSNDDGSSAGSSRDKALNVVATTTLVQDVVRTIGGDRVAVTGILKPNAEAVVSSLGIPSFTRRLRRNRSGG
jgi:ABC-type Zn uptake system ZnuABC Zn-binding protein ZnuA